MEPLIKETFLSYAEECNWLLFGEISTPTGRQAQYVTPAGNFIYAVYNLKGDLLGLAMPVLQQPQQPPNLQRGFIDPRGEGSLPS